MKWLMKGFFSAPFLFVYCILSVLNSWFLCRDPCKPPFVDYVIKRDKLCKFTQLGIDKLQSTCWKQAEELGSCWDSHSVLRSPRVQIVGGRWMTGRQAPLSVRSKCSRRLISSSSFRQNAIINRHFIFPHPMQSPCTHPTLEITVLHCFLLPLLSHLFHRVEACYKVPFPSAPSYARSHPFASGCMWL